jgi:ADP-heptose:LPS heptosyltransferase
MRISDNRSERRVTPAASRRRILTHSKNLDGDCHIWINPIGGLGDALMISSVLWQVFKSFPNRRYNLVERTKYRAILEGHPAINYIGDPPSSANFIGTDYWRHEDFTKYGARAYQVLARIFGLETPVEERYYVPWQPKEDPVLIERMPWRLRNVIVCQSSDSPRKQMHLVKWEELVAKLLADDIGVIQVGRMRDPYIRGSYSLLGLTTPQQLVGMVRHVDAVITSDSFLMHAAHLCEVPAVVLWGPTDHRVYGHRDHIHMRATATCDQTPSCIGIGKLNMYQVACTYEPHCMNTIEVEDIFASVKNLL